MAGLTQTLERDGAVLGSEQDRPLHFGDPRAELDCARQACVLADRSDLGRLLAVGPDYLALLNRLSTGDVGGLQPGEGKPTVLTTPKGRIVERLFVHHLGPEGVLSIGGARSGPRVLEHIGRFTFSENTGLTDETGSGFQLTISGPRAAAVFETGGWAHPAPFHGKSSVIGGCSVRILGQDGLSDAGYSVCGRHQDAPAVWSALAEATAGCGGRPTGDEVLEAYRILHGLPASGHELTEEHNPLEAGLWEAVSFDKGCYVGQEVVARLRTYDKVSRSVVGLQLPEGAEFPAVGARLFLDGRDVGALTSVVLPPDRSAPLGLGYVKRKEIRPGLELRTGGPEGPVAALVELPFDRP